MHSRSLSDKLAASSHDWSHVSSPPGSSRKRIAAYDFPGYGSYDVRASPLPAEMDHINSSMQFHEGRRVLLGQLEATAIAGNDILSSTFYVTGLVTLAAGKMAPACLALVAFVLYLFRGIYHETVTALPVNGGTYTVLLNCTSKQIASLAAVFNIIAYITTAVVSALDGIAYLQTALPERSISELPATILLLSFFCLLTNLGIKESATFAKIIFVIHLTTLSILTFFGTIHMCVNPYLLFENWKTPYPNPSLRNQPSTVLDASHGNFLTALFFGFSAAILGVSGFESSAQFVEEQAPNVFPKTLRNMWAAVMFFNPLLSLISFSALSVSEITEHKETVLAMTANVVGNWLQINMSIPQHFKLGPAFSTLVSVDAFVVLAAAVLTSFIGINGLIRRMSMDRCLPQFLLFQNPYTGTDSFILVGFFLLCVSQVLLLNGNVAALGAVYCYAFMSVMIIFAFGNVLLKIKRPSLPREISVSWLQTIIGLVLVVMAFLGNVIRQPRLLFFFFLYGFVVGAFVFVMFQRVLFVRLLYKMLEARLPKVSTIQEGEDVREGDSIAPVLLEEGDGMTGEQIALLKRNRHKTYLSSLSSALISIQDVPFIFFCKHDDIHLLNKVVLYIQRNEQTNKIIIVHCTNDTDQALLTEHVKVIDLLYPKKKISLLIVDSAFCPATIEWLSQTLKVPINAMFISCPDESFAMKVNQLRGMRIITSYDG